MSEDYLWDMTGSDPEIEKLEAALSSISFKGGTAPKIPLRKRSWFVTTWRPTFRLQAGFAALCVAVIALASFWMIQPRRPAVVSEPDRIMEPKPQVIETDETVNPPEPPIEGPRANGKRGLLTARYKLQRKPKTMNAVHKEKLIIVTPEEASAYNKLMLALAITSTNLRIVRDTVAGIDKESPDRKSDR